MGDPTWTTEPPSTSLALDEASESTCEPVSDRPVERQVSRVAPPRPWRQAPRPCRRMEGVDPSVQLTIDFTVEQEAGDTPALVAAGALGFYP